MSWQTVALSAATFVLGVVGATFFTTPLQRFWEMRGRVSRAVNEYARYIRGTPTSEEMMELAVGARGQRESAVQAFRDLGLDLVAFADNNFFLRRCLLLARIDAKKSGLALISLANALHAKAPSNVGRDDIVGPLLLC
jgi:hypothetical protein